MDERLETIKSWIKTDLGMPGDDLAPASSDASFRRYFRFRDGSKTFIVMDAPPQHEDCRPFIKVANAFAQLQLHVPQIIEQDLTQGFLLLSDLGSRQYLGALDETSVDVLYGDALRALAFLQKGGQGQTALLPPYDAPLLQREVHLFDEWFLTKHLGLTLRDEHRSLLEQTYQFLIDSALQQPQSWVHRDYHSRNLMVCDASNPGILDFQDAVYGPLTYDVVSLLKDCYIAWPRERVTTWVDDYFARLHGEVDLAGFDRRDFLRAFDLMGVQRHLKAIGIFARLNIRDGKPGYLKDIPRTLGYVQWAAQHYDELAAFARFLCDEVEPLILRSHRENR